MRRPPGRAQGSPQARRGTNTLIPSSSQLPEEALLGNRLDSHDWEKISNINVSRGQV